MRFEARLAGRSNILNEIGSWIVAEYLGIDPREVGYRNDRKRTLINSSQLRHTRAANSFFTRLIFATRSAGSLFRVTEWRGESWCERRWRLHLRPDGFAQLEVQRVWGSKTRFGRDGAGM